MRTLFLLLSLVTSAFFLSSCVIKTNPQDFQPYFAKKLLFARNGLLIKSNVLCAIQEKISLSSEYLVLTPERQKVVQCKVVGIIPKGTAFYVEKVLYKDIPDVLTINVYATIASGKFKGIRIIFPSNICKFIPYNTLTQKNYCQENAKAVAAGKKWLDKVNKEPREKYFIPNNI